MLPPREQAHDNSPQRKFPPNGRSCRLPDTLGGGKGTAVRGGTVSLRLRLTLLVTLLTAGCASLPAAPQQASPATPTAAVSPSAAPPRKPSAPATPTQTPSPTPTATLLVARDNPEQLLGWTPQAATLTPEATPLLPRGVVLEQSNCRYGPASAYLYEWGLYPKDRVTILARNETGAWLFVQPWNYLDQCWVKTSLLDISGDIFTVPAFVPPLPPSELYGPVSNVWAKRLGGNAVRIEWQTIWMTEDDDRGYLIEVWVCHNGQLEFEALHSDVGYVIVQDEPGCTVASSGRVYAAEKHGYTRWIAVPWPS
jgi:hypothetical protein